MRERVIALFVCTRDFLVRFSRARIRFIALFAGGGSLLIGACDFRIGVVPLFFGGTAALLRGNERFLQLRNFGFEGFLCFTVVRTGGRSFLQRSLRLTQLIAHLLLSGFRFVEIALSFIEFRFGFIEAAVQRLLFIFSRAHLGARFLQFSFELIDSIAQFASGLLDRNLVRCTGRSRLRCWRRRRCGLFGDLGRWWFWRSGRVFNGWRGRGYILLGRSSVLHAQNAFAHFTAAIFDDGGLPFRMAFA